MGALRWGLVATALGLSLGLSCSYAPSFDGGVLACTATSGCPKGYGCADDGTCWKDGTGPNGADVLGKYVGNWTFDSGNLVSDCSDGAPSTTALMGDPVIVKASGTGLTASYYCDWILHRPSGSAAAVADAGQSCQQVVPDTATNLTYTYTWSAKSFSFSTTDGQTAMVSGHVAGPFTASDNTTGTCDGTFSGTLMKTP
jgi:hypothetical protein